MSHTNKHSYKSTVFLKMGTREKYIKLTFKNSWRAGGVPPDTSKLVNAEKHQHHYAVITNHIIKSTLRAKKHQKIQTLSKGQIREVFLTLPQRHNVQSRWGKPCCPLQTWIQTL